LILRPTTPEDIAWIEDHVGVLKRNATSIAAIRPDGQIAGVVAYDSWHPGSVQVHIALASPMAWRALSRAVWDYAFEQEGVESVLATIPSHRCEAIRMAILLGFKSTHRVRDGFCPGSDLVHFQMRRSECRFLDSQRKAA
jgi:hypothetical protein